MGHEVSVDLLAEERFAPVVDAFAKTLDETDRSGAALSVWLDGEPVIEARGGTADGRTGEAWLPDTPTVVFSCTKGLAAIAIGRLLESGALSSLDVPVADIWAEFAAHGKEKVSVGDALAHRAAPDSVDWTTARTRDWAWAAALPLAGLTAQTALARLGTAPGQTLLINRTSSAVGRFAAQVAEARGIEVVALEGDGGADSGARAGSGAAGDTRAGAGADSGAGAGSGAGSDSVVNGFVDAALDVVGADAALAAFARVKDGGRYATIVPEFWLPGGQFTAARGIEPVTVFVDEAVGDLAELSRWAAEGILRPQIAEILPLADAADAHRRMAAGGGRGKLILVP